MGWGGSVADSYMKTTDHFMKQPTNQLLVVLELKIQEIHELKRFKRSI